MPTVRISGKSMKHLKTWAEPLEDTVESAISKVSDAAERHRRAHAPQRPEAARSVERTGKSVRKTPQKEFERPVLEALYELGGAASKADVCSLVGERMKRRLLPGDFERVSTGEERWSNAACWARSESRKKGYLRKNWELCRRVPKLAHRDRLRTRRFGAGACLIRTGVVSASIASSTVAFTRASASSSAFVGW